MKQLLSDRTPPVRSLLLGVSLLPAVGMLCWFHYGNRFVLGTSGWAFLDVPFRFLTQIGRFRLTFPDGLLFWSLFSVFVMAVPWWFGWSLLLGSVPCLRTRSLVAFPVGLGVVGVFLEGLAMAGWFNRWSVLILYLGFTVLAFLFGKKKRSTTDPINWNRNP